MNNIMKSYIHKDHDQPDNKPILNKRNKNSFEVFHQNICSQLNKKKNYLTL